MDARRIFEELFNRAREADEFEYACTLLRLRGMEEAGWDPLEETAALFKDVGSLLQTPLNDLARIRLGLLPHLTEVPVSPGSQLAPAWLPHIPGGRIRRLGHP
jgi:hypothetical protein